MGPTKTIQTTIYFVGEDADDAASSLFFDSWESAESYRLDNPGTRIFSAPAVISLDLMEPVGNE